MNRPVDFDWRSYTTGIEVLYGAIQQIELVPFEDMEVFLRRSIEATDPDGELPVRKINAARRQLELIGIAKRFVTEVRRLLEEDAA